MRGPSAKYLYGLTSTFGTSVNVTQAELDAWDREAAAEVKDQRNRQAAAERRAAAVAAFRQRTGGATIPAVLEVEQLIEDRQRGR